MTCDQEKNHSVEASSETTDDRMQKWYICLNHKIRVLNSCHKNTQSIQEVNDEYTEEKEGRYQKKKNPQTPTGYKLNFWDEKYTRQENNILSTEQEKVILCSQIRKLNTVNTSLLPKLIYRFFFNLNKDFIRLSVEIKLILKFIWEMTWNSQSNFLKNEQICITSRLIIKPQKSGQGYKGRHNHRT